jgi:hypothetical protein
MNNLFAKSEDSRYFLFTYITIEKSYYDFNYQVRRLPLHMLFNRAGSNGKIRGLYEVSQLELEIFKQSKVVK